MLNNWKLKACVPLASAAVLVGCDRGDDRRAAAGDAQPISVTGCVATGIGTNQYMLTNVRFAPRGEQPSDPQSYAGTGITEHSQVRLSAEDEEQLRQLVGQVASVTGAIKDDGRNTIGTSGPAPGPDDPEPRTDRSQQATDQKHSEKVAEEAGPIGTRSMNNGTFPEIAVHRIEATGQNCQTQPVEGRR